MIINTRKLREDHPSIQSGYKTTKKRITPGNAWAFAMLRAHLLQLIQEVRELHADVPPPTGTLEEN